MSGVTGAPGVPVGWSNDSVGLVGSIGVGRDHRQRRIVGQERERVHLVRVVVDPVAGAHHRLLAEAIGRAQPRREILVVRLGELEPFDRIGRQVGRGNDRQEVLSQHVRDAGIRLHRRAPLVPQAETQRQVPFRLPVVVDEEPVAPAADVPLNLVGRRNHRPRQSPA